MVCYDSCYNILQGIRLKPGNAYFVRVVARNSVGKSSTQDAPRIVVEYFVQPYLAEDSKVLVALPYSQDGSGYHVWQQNKKRQKILMNVYSLPSLEVGDEMLASFGFAWTEAGNDLTATAVSRIQIETQGGSQQLEVDLPELPVGCGAGCSAKLRLYPERFPTKVVEREIELFRYADPTLLSVFPTVGATQGGTLVKLSLQEDTGDSRPSRHDAGLFSLKNEDLQVSVLFTCTEASRFAHFPTVSRVYSDDVLLFKVQG
jgi:hypothetical protein